MIFFHNNNGDILEKDRKYYSNLTKTEKNYKQMTKSFLFAFLGGGFISILGQVILSVLNFFNKETPQDNPLYLSLIMIFISGLLTGLGVYDKLGQIFKCGLSIPITGFANATVSSAIEYHKEGIVLGIGANALKLAGSVIVLGVVSAVIVGSIRYWIGLI